MPTRAWSSVAASGPVARTDWSIVVERRQPGRRGPAVRGHAPRRCRSRAVAHGRARRARGSSEPHAAQVKTGALPFERDVARGATRAGVRSVAHPAAPATSNRCHRPPRSPGAGRRRLPWHVAPWPPHCPSAAVVGEHVVPPVHVPPTAELQLPPGALFVVTHVLLAAPRSRGALEGVGAADLLLAGVGPTDVRRRRAAGDAVRVRRSGDEAGSGPGATGDGGAANQDLASVHPELRTLSAGGAAASVAVEPVVTHLLTNPQ